MRLRGLRIKLTMTLVLSVALLGIGASLVVPMAQEAGLYDAFAERLRLNTEAMAAVLKQVPEERWQAMVSAHLSSDAHARWLQVSDSVGKTLAATKVEGLPEDMKLAEPTQSEAVTDLGDGYLRVVAPIRPGVTLTIGFSDEGHSGPLSEARRSRMIFGGVAIVFFALLGWFLGGRFTDPLQKTSDRLTKVSQDLLSAARAREASAAEEAAAVEETRRTMDMLLSSAQKIADSASAVLGNAERTLDGNREIADRIELLNRHAEKVAEILASIMQVADRTDLLALNAALEGTKAGEAGKGFTLVAKEMRRLAENVMDSVEGIRRLMRDVRTAGQGAVESSHDGTRFSEETTRSVREIALVTQQQRKATEQVSRSMDEMTELLNHAMADIKQTTRSAAELSQVSTLLAELVVTGEKKKS